MVWWFQTSHRSMPHLQIVLYFGYPFYVVFLVHCQNISPGCHLNLASLMKKKKGTTFYPSQRHFQWQPLQRVSEDATQNNPHRAMDSA
uniref:Uncharacterized protein n=1 Tax=Arundo donax TaxID=35708 RepID=A0A0A8ZXF3_ARUDO